MKTPLCHNLFVAEPILKLHSVRGVELAVWEWPGEGTPLVFAHATGFHARCWDGVIRRMPGRRALAVDLRGHGRSSKPDPPYPWREFGADLAALTCALGVQGAIGVGHSMGGHSIVSSAIVRPEAYRALVLIDPTIFAPERYGAEPQDSSFIGRRRRYWDSPAEMFANFRERIPFSRWQPEVLRDYCEYGLLPAGTEWELACPPLVEAAIYPQSVARESNLHEELSAVAQPVTVVRSAIPWSREKFDLNSSPTVPDLASRFAHGRDVLLSERTHFIPMEDPEWVARLLLVE